MDFIDNMSVEKQEVDLTSIDKFNLNQREKEVLSIYLKRHNGNKHKIEMPPVCVIPEKLK